ncbi:MAG: DNA-binding LytR/AlgR family response regulator [Granulosicoccus sp.]|jgi:DNA-binding LytR/AlgR family response regulator
MKILIIEDEIRAAQQLQIMLKNNYPNFTILDTLESVEDSVAWLNNNTPPNLILMDIQLADGLSFEIFQQVNIEVPVIFTTAYDQYSIKAFKVNSVDYLLKPIQENELKSAIEKYQRLYTQNTSSNIDTNTLEKLITNLVAEPARKRFMVKNGGAMTFVSMEEVAYFYSEDGISFLVKKNNKRYILEMTLDAIEKDISRSNFFRINRSQIVGIESVEKIHPYFNHRLKLDISGNSKLEFVVSRNRTSEFKAWVNT